MKRRFACKLILAAPMLAAPALAQGPVAPHEWLFGSWTGGMFPAADTIGPRCTAQPTVIFTRDVVLRSGLLDPAYRQRIIETVVTRADGATFRFSPIVPPGAAAGRLPPDIAFGCPGGPDTLEVRRVGPDEIVFPDCRDMPSPLRRCGSPER
ncbi:hypothetical protein [Roseomonas sp. CECT 9278]|uniref:hypothetical protein n=1 Tax=Roseomonas sp. CECT 9278 TaxID=2845823 RepID=UPI001E6091B4|nr:hypothetical protein [Roseomonas sp. CECT 9278]CAH0262175.1 hypothetical protein ROS9278_03429 [Roseomonas sp. CECT 9278]